MHDESIEEYILCKEIYHCTPQELDEVDYHTSQTHLLIHSIYHEKAHNSIAKFKSKKNGHK